MASGATCVQRLDGSRDSAIHTKYRISLRSSSMREPRYPLPRVVMTFAYIANARSPRRITVSGARGQASFFSYSLARAAPGFVWVPKAIGINRTPPTSRGFEGRGPPHPPNASNEFTGRSAVQVSTMILPQVHLRKPCYDFYFL